MRTTLDPRLQTAARIALMDGLETYDRRHGWRGAWGHVAIEPGWEKAALAASRRRPSGATGASAVVERRRRRRGAGEARADGSERRHRRRPTSPGRRPARALKVGDLVFVEPARAAGARCNLRQVPIVNGALVAMDPYTGRVLAMVGGYSLLAVELQPRHPGDAPARLVVQAVRLRHGAGERLHARPASCSDAPDLAAGRQRRRPGRRRTTSSNFLGPLIFRRGLELSLQHHDRAHRPAGRHAEDRRQRQASSAWSTSMEPVLAMALGAGETTPFRLTAAYSAFVNGGRKINPHLIELVEDRDGKTIFRADERDCHRCNARLHRRRRPRLRARRAQQVMDPITAYQITSMLQGVVQHGTAIQARDAGPAGRRQDRHHQRLPQRLVRRLLAAASWSASSSASTTTARWATARPARWPRCRSSSTSCRRR